MELGLGLVAEEVVGDRWVEEHSRARPDKRAPRGAGHPSAAAPRLALDQVAAAAAPRLASEHVAAAAAPRLASEYYIC